MLTAWLCYLPDGLARAVSVNTLVLVSEPPVSPIERRGWRRTIASLTPMTRWLSSLRPSRNHCRVTRCRGRRLHNSLNTSCCRGRHLRYQLDGSPAISLLEARKLPAAVAPEAWAVAHIGPWRCRRVRNDGSSTRTRRAGVQPARMAFVRRCELPYVFGPPKSVGFYCRRSRTRRPNFRIGWLRTDLPPSDHFHRHDTRIQKKRCRSLPRDVTLLSIVLRGDEPPRRRLGQSLNVQ